MDESPLTLAQAAQSGNVSGALQQLLMSRVKTPVQMEGLEKERSSALQGYQEALQSNPTPGVGPLTHGLYSWLSNVGKMPPAYAAIQGVASMGPFMEQQGLTRHSGDISAAKVGYEDVKDRETQANKDLMALKSGLSNKAAMPTVKMDKDGNMVVFDPASNESRVVHSSMVGEFNRLKKLGYEKAVEERMEDPEGYATRFATQMMGDSIKTYGARPSAVPGSPVTTQTTPAVKPAATPTPASTALDKSQRAKIIYDEWLANKKVTEDTASQPDSENYQVALRNMAEARKELMSQYSIDPVKGFPTTTTPGTTTETPKLTYDDRRVAAQDKGYGAKEGEGLYKEREGLNQLHGANSKILSQLNMLEQIYQNPNIPEGELGPKLQALRSGLKSLNISVDDSVGAADLANAIATGMSLAQKNADGHNLLPGAMSNYEDQLLQKMAPTLSLTAEGRTMLVQFMKEVAIANMRLASEGTQLAGENKDRLPASWFKRKERVMLEEMVRLKRLSEKMLPEGGAK